MKNIYLYFYCVFVLIQNINAQYTSSISSDRLPPNGNWHEAGATQLKKDCGITPIIAYINVLKQSKEFVPAPLVRSLIGDNGLEDNTQKLVNILEKITNNPAYESKKGYFILYFPYGKYLFNDQITLPNNVIIKGDGANAVQDQSITYNYYTSNFEQGTVFRFSFNDYNMLSKTYCINLINHSGVEDITIELSTYNTTCWFNSNVISTDAKTNTIIMTGESSWVRGVLSYKTAKAHIQITGNHNSIKNSYFHDAQGYGSNGYGYGIDLTGNSYYNLVENSIFKHLRHSVVLQVNTSLNVIGYNYCFDRFAENCFGDYLLGDIVFHGPHNFYNTTGPRLNLIEGNFANQIKFDMAHGTNGNYNTLLRDYTVNDFVISDKYLGQPYDDMPNIPMTWEAGDNQYDQNIVGCNMTPTNKNDFEKIKGDGIYKWGNYSGSWLWGWDWNKEYSDLTNNESYYLNEKPIFIPYWQPWPYLPGDNVANWAKERWDYSINNPNSTNKYYSAAEISLWKNYECEYAEDLKKDWITITGTKNMIGTNTVEMYNVTVPSGAELSVGAVKSIKIGPGTSFKAGCNVVLYIDDQAPNRYNTSKRFTCGSSFNYLLVSDIKDMHTGIQDDKKDNNTSKKNDAFIIYPNPVSDNLQGYIPENKTEKLIYYIQDYTGKIVLTDKLDNQNLDINVVSLPQGYYTFVVITSTTKYVRSFIKQ